MSLAQLAPSIAAASSNLIVSAEAEDQTVTRIIDNINRMGFMASSDMKSAPAVKLSRNESPGGGLAWPRRFRRAAAGYNPRTRPASISSRLKRRASAPALQA